MTDIPATKESRPFMQFLSGLFDRNRPSYLLVLFSIFSALSSGAIILLVGFGIFRIYTAAITEEAEHDAVSIAEAILGHERDLLISTAGNGAEQLRIAPTDFGHLDVDMKKYLHPFRMFKIKVFAPDKKIVYSTDAAIIGRTDDQNARLMRALSGATDSSLKKKKELSDLAGETRFDADVVETYLPIKSSSGKIIGAYEIYTDVSRYRAKVREVLVSSVAVMLVVMFFAVGGLFLIMRVGAGQVERVRKEMERVAVTDSLTGLFNRGHIMGRLGSEFSKMVRLKDSAEPKKSLGIIMLDLDYFKRINDTYGHQAGDEVLREVGRRLKETVRGYDMAGRYGGEEFLVVLPGSGLPEAVMAAERIRQSIREKPFTFAGETLNLTASIGVACLNDDDPDIEGALATADERLYSAKHTGRDRIVSSPARGRKAGGVIGRLEII